MSQKIVILFLILFIIVSFSWLAYNEKEQHQISNQWFLYFQNPTDDSLNFTIENYTDNPDFVWQLLNNNKIIETKKIKVLKKRKKTIIIKERTNDFLQIKVLHNEKDKIIYK